MKLINPGNLYSWPNPADPLQTIGSVLYFASYRCAERYMEQMYPDSTVPPERRREFMVEVESATLPNQSGIAFLPVKYGSKRAERFVERIWGVVASSVDAALVFNLRVQAGTSLEKVNSSPPILQALESIEPVRLEYLDEALRGFCR